MGAQGVGVCASFLEIDQNQPFSPFSGGPKQHLGNRDNRGKGLFPQMSSDSLEPLSLKFPFAAFQRKPERTQHVYMKIAYWGCPSMASSIVVQRKLKGNNERAKSSRHFFTLFGTFPHFLTLFQSFSEFFPPGLFLRTKGFYYSVTTVLVQRDEKRITRKRPNPLAC